MALIVIGIKVQIVEISSFATRTIYYTVLKLAHKQVYGAIPSLNQERSFKQSLNLQNQHVNKHMAQQQRCHLLRKLNM